MAYIAGIILGLLGMLAYQVTQKRSAQAIIQNLKVDQKENTLDKTILTNDAAISQQEQVQQDIKNQKTGDQNENLDQLNDFFNNDK